MSFAFIEEHREVWPVTVLCETLGVSAQGFYAWRARPASAQQQRRDTLLVEIRAVHAEVKQRYGSPRIHAELQAKGVPCSVNTVAQLMHDNAIRAKTARKFRNTTDSNHPLPVAQNVLDRQFDAQGPNERWLTDITYIPTREGWLYLAVVEDLYSRRVVGWSMAAWSSMPWKWRWPDACPRKACWPIPIGAASTPASTTSVCWPSTASSAA